MLGCQNFLARFGPSFLGYTIDAQQLWCEFSLCPNQVKVDYVITKLMSDFRLGFDPAMVSLKVCSPRYAFSNPSAIGD